MRGRQPREYLVGRLANPFFRVGLADGLVTFAHTFATQPPHHQGATLDRPTAPRVEKGFMRSVPIGLLAGTVVLALAGCSPREIEVSLTASSDVRFRAEITHETVVSDAAGRVIDDTTGFGTPVRLTLAPGVDRVFTTISTAGTHVTRPQPGDFRPGGLSGTSYEGGPPARVGVCQVQMVVTRPIAIRVDVTTRGCTIGEEAPSAQRHATSFPTG